MCTGEVLSRLSAGVGEIRKKKKKKKEEKKIQKYRRAFDMASVKILRVEFPCCVDLLL